MESANQTVRYGGFWRRLTAYGIDGTIVQLLAFLAIYLLGQAANAQAAQDADTIQQLITMGWLPAPQDGQSINDVLRQSGASGTPLFSGLDVLIALMISGIYNTWFTAGAWQATPGKRWCGMEVVMIDGRRLSLAMSAIRWFASGISWLPLGGGYLMAAFSREKVSMHDAICGTRVIFRQR